MDESSINVICRPFDREKDQAFVYSSWCRAALYGVPHRTPNHDGKKFFKEQTIKINDILKHAQVRVACMEHDPRMIVGYSVHTGSHLDWIYVKVEYRKKGIGTLLFPAGIETVTNQLTKIGAAIAAHKKLVVINGPN